MLPFLKRKETGISTGGIQIKHREPDEHTEDKDDPSAAHEACAKELLKAIESKDIKGIADALHDAFTLMDSEPHEEGEHTEPHSYDAQNEE